MTVFDTVVMVDWSAAKRSPVRPSKDAIWIGVARGGVSENPHYCRSRHDAEFWLAEFFDAERAAGHRVFAGFDFPFGYPTGFARCVTGADDPFALWDWFEKQITDDPRGNNNRFDVAEQMNALFRGQGPFWGKSHKDRWPGIPYNKQSIVFDQVAERRTADLAAKASSSCFQLFYNPTVGSQILMGLPVLTRLRRRGDVAVWPFENCDTADVVFAEIWPGLIEHAVRSVLKDAPKDEIRDRVQVRLLSKAISLLGADEFDKVMTQIPDVAREEAWIFGIGYEDRLSELALQQMTTLNPPPLRNDCFALPAGVNWTPVDDALSMLRERLTPVTGVEDVALNDALGRVLSQDVMAKRSNPPQANSAVDGYGFAGAVPEGARVMTLVEGRAAAGVPFVSQVPAGQAIRILTGAALPEGVDTVILEEDVTLGDGQIAFRGPLKQGANARDAGEDVVAGKTVLTEGRVLTPADLALLSAVGVSRVPTRKALRVAVISTGDELVESGERARQGQIYDANRPMLLAMARRFGAETVDMGRVADNRNALREALDAAADQADVILTSGGASAGDEDHVSALLSEAGAMQEWRIAVKPGRPLALGLWQGTPVFGLPGNPVAAMVCTLVFARPAMALLAGAGWAEPQGFSLPAAFEKRKKAGRREYLRGRIRDGRVEAFKSEGSGRISGLSWAEGLIEIEDGARDIQPGDLVRFIPYPSFGL